MNIIEITNRTPQLIQQLVDIWERAVRETHSFLSDTAIDTIKEYVPQALQEIPHLIVVENDQQIPLAFMGIQEKKLEMLFVDAVYRGNGIGKQLVHYGKKGYQINEVTVNEQNPQAKGFYEHLGFETYKRTELDEQGEPYPILYMKLNT